MIYPQWPAPAQVKSVCTTRAGGVSMPPYESLNLGTHVGDDVLHVQQNRSLLRQTIATQPIFMEQVHGTRVLEMDASTHNGMVADAAITQALGVACTVMVADCLPVLFCNRQGTLVAAAHAGWRGLADGVLEATVQAMKLRGCQATDILAWLGPCIGPHAFEVGDEVRATFVQQNAAAATCFTPLGAHKWMANLAALAHQRLNALGVLHIYGNDGRAQWCTVSNASTFFSHRRDRVSGRQAVCIWLV